jgi:regulator of RNase E activity RraA
MTTVGSLPAALEDASSAEVSDVLDRMWVMSGAIRHRAGPPRCVGRALTVWVRPGDNLGVREAIDQVRTGDVVVVGNAGAVDRALLGDILAQQLYVRGASGVVLDGAVRDLDGIDQVGLPVWAAGVTPAGPSHHGPGFIGCPVACGGLVVHTDDVMVADRDGVAVVPADRLQDVVGALAARLCDDPH